jgi:hypothetical protein
MWARAAKRQHSEQAPAASARATAAGTEAVARSLLTVAGKGRALEKDPYGEPAVAI